MDSKTLAKLAAIASMAEIAVQAGLVLVGGIKALAGIFGHSLTQEEQDAIEVAVLIDAKRRRSERSHMTGDL